MAPTIKDVAKYAGVGIGTVSRVLNGGHSVNERTRLRVRDAIAALNYTSNRMAARLRRNETGDIALLVPVIYHPFFSELAYYVEDEADKFGYSVLLVSSQQRVQKEADILARIRRREVDGAVFVTHYAHTEEEIGDCPVVSIDRSFGAKVPFVTSDNYDATVRAVEYLIERGCRNIGYIGSKPLVDSEVMERERAYRDVMAKYGMQIRSVNRVIQHGAESEIVSDFLERFPQVDGVFASGYTLAQVMYETAQAKGLDIPNDLQIVSYDGAFRQWNNNRLLTCVEQPIEEMARMVVRALLARIRGEIPPARVVCKTSFVIGATTK